jgi:hypothetical protein
MRVDTNVQTEFASNELWLKQTGLVFIMNTRKRAILAGK